MKFDNVIGNPPYQNGKNKNFYVKFVDWSADHLKETGYFAFVVPNRFVLPHSKISKSLREHFQIDFLDVDVNSHFPKVGTRIGYLLARPTNKMEPYDVQLSDVMVRSSKQQTIP